jgi:hypothetical protein
MDTLILCPACGADRLIPLSFPQLRAQAGPATAFRHPIAKCCACGTRVFAHLDARSLLSMATDQERSRDDQPRS